MTYKGGKAGAGVYQQIINQIPPHEVYIEPFLGGGAVLLNKKPAACTIGIDSDTDVILQWESLGYGAIVVNEDAISYLQKLRCELSTFIYCDPPYLFETRRSHRRIYRHEFGEVDQHKKLLEVLKSLPCMVAISSYWSSLYATSLQGWRLVQFNAKTRQGVATECLWMNYPEPFELHDYRYLGENFRERERIKRKQKRWDTRLEKMPALERYALMQVIEPHRQK